MVVAKGRVLLGWGVAACCMFAVPAAASADVHCVFANGDDSICPAGSVEHGPDLQGALDAAALDTTAPAVVIGAGTFDPPPNATSFTYTGSTPLPIAGQDTSTALSAGFASQSAPATVLDLAVNVPAGRTGVDLQEGGTVDGLTISAPAGVGNVRGVSVRAPSTIENTTIAFDPTQETAGLVDALPLTAAGTVRLRDSDITAADGVQFQSKLVLAVARSTLTGATGVDELGGGTTTVSNSVIAKTVAGGRPINYQSTDNKTLTVTNVTAVDLADDSGDAAVRANPSGIGTTMNVNVADSVLSGFDHVVDSAPTFPATVVTALTRNERYDTLAG